MQPTVHELPKNSSRDSKQDKASVLLNQLVNIGSWSTGLLFKKKVDIFTQLVSVNDQMNVKVDKEKKNVNKANDPDITSRRKILLKLKKQIIQNPFNYEKILLLKKIASVWKNGQNVVLFDNQSKQSFPLKDSSKIETALPVKITGRPSQITNTYVNYNQKNSKKKLKFNLSKR